jgi:hypothetical protein
VGQVGRVELHPHALQAPFDRHAHGLGDGVGGAGRRRTQVRERRVGHVPA